MKSNRTRVPNLGNLCFEERWTTAIISVIGDVWREFSRERIPVDADKYEGLHGYVEGHVISRTSALERRMRCERADNLHPGESRDLSEGVELREKKNDGCDGVEGRSGFGRVEMELCLWGGCVHLSIKMET